MNEVSPRLWEGEKWVGVEGGGEGPRSKRRWGYHERGEGPEQVGEEKREDVTGQSGGWVVVFFYLSWRWFVISKTIIPSHQLSLFWPLFVNVRFMLREGGSQDKQQERCVDYAGGVYKGIQQLSPCDIIRAIGSDGVIYICDTITNHFQWKSSSEVGACSN